MSHICRDVQGRIKLLRAYTTMLRNTAELSPVPQKESDFQSWVEGAAM